MPPTTAQNRDRDDGASPHLLSDSARYWTQVAQPALPFTTDICQVLIPPLYVILTPSFQLLAVKWPPTPVSRHATPPGLYARFAVKPPGSPATHSHEP